MRGICLGLNDVLFNQALNLPAYSRVQPTRDGTLLELKPAINP